MIKFLIGKFIKGEDTEKAEVREQYCVLGGVLGVICNLFLFVLKLVIGTIMGSIAITSDAFNNLSDIGSSAVSVIGAKLSNKKPDKEHPFGHGRFEYISALIVSFIIILVGFELLRTSAAKIIKPEKITFSIPLVCILLVSVLVKVWMFSYNKYLGSAINSEMLIATAKDSLNDVVSTLAIILTTVVNKYLNFAPLDGIVGTVVSVMIIYSGFEIARDTIGMLLGTPPDSETIKKIQSYILGADGIVGMHDLIIHDYGPGRKLASVHAEVPDDCNIVKIHEVIDGLEHKILKDLGIHTVIHMDPISVNCGRTAEIRETVLDAVKALDVRMNIHDFRMTDGDNRINLIFDIEVPPEYTDTEKLKNTVAEKLREIDPRYSAVIDVDTIYC